MHGRRVQRALPELQSEGSISALYRGGHFEYRHAHTRAKDMPSAMPRLRRLSADYRAPLQRALPEPESDVRARCPAVKKPLFGGMPTANAEGARSNRRAASERSRRDASLAHLHIGHGASAFAVGMLRDVERERKGVELTCRSQRRMSCTMSSSSDIGAGLWPPLYRLYIGSISAIADGTSIARVLTCRYSK